MIADVARKRTSGVRHTTPNLGLHDANDDQADHADDQGNAKHPGAQHPAHTGDQLAGGLAFQHLFERLAVFRDVHPVVELFRRYQVELREMLDLLRRQAQEPVRIIVRRVFRPRIAWICHPVIVPRCRCKYPKSSAPLTANNGARRVWQNRITDDSMPLTGGLGGTVL